MEVLALAKSGLGYRQAQRPRVAAVQVVVEVEAGLVWVYLIRTVLVGVLEELRSNVLEQAAVLESWSTQVWKSTTLFVPACQCSFRLAKCVMSANGGG